LNQKRSVTKKRIKFWRQCSGGVELCSIVDFSGGSDVSYVRLSTPVET